MLINLLGSIMVLLIGNSSVLCYTKHGLEARQFYGFKINFTQPYRTDTNVRYKIDCIVACVSNTSCIAVEHQDQTCHFYDNVPYLNEDETLAISLIIVRDGLFVFHLQSEAGWYQYSFLQAYQACIARGGQLATRAEMQSLYEAGFELCWCGWISDGDRIYIMQEITEHCMNGDTGLISCADDFGKVNAFCVLV